MSGLCLACLVHTMINAINHRKSTARVLSFLALYDVCSGEVIYKQILFYFIYLLLNHKRRAGVHRASCLNNLCRFLPQNFHD